MLNPLAWVVIAMLVTGLMLIASGLMRSSGEAGPTDGAAAVVGAAQDSYECSGPGNTPSRTSLT